jgi:predicted aspartyl protease
MKTVYLRQYFPPFPSLPIHLGFPEHSLSLGPLDALIDTGADGTLVPQALLDELGAPLVDQIQLRSQWGEARPANLYTVDLGVSDLRLPAIEVVGDPGTEIILGRDVLNRLRILLDGPAGETTLIEK